MPLNLITDAWMPMHCRNGAPDDLPVIRPAQIVAGLHETGGNPAVFPSWPRPDLNIATLEFLVGLLSVAMPPEDVDDWAGRWRTPPTVEELDAALAPYALAFNVDGDGPRFMQDVEALEGNDVSVDALFIDSAGENTVRKNADVMVKRARYGALSRASAAIALYALQQFAPTGGAGHRTSMRGGGPLTTLALPSSADGAEPATLWRIAWLNVRPSGSGPVKTEQMAHVFPWLAQTLTSETGLEIHEADERAHTNQAFFGMPRRIRLQFKENTQDKPCDLTGGGDGVIVSGVVSRPYGVNYGQWRHHLTPYYRKKEGDPECFAMHPPAGPFGYRNWVALVIGDEQGTRHRAEAVGNAGERLRDVSRDTSRAQLLIAGWSMSNMRPLDYVMAKQPLHLVADAAVQRKVDDFARRLVLAAERAATLLIGGLQAALELGGNKPGADSARLAAVRDAFFTTSEIDFHRILHEAASEAEDNDSWQPPFESDWWRVLQHTAFRVFDETVEPDPSSLRKARQVVQARRNLTKGLFSTTGQKSPGAVLILPVDPKPKEKSEGAQA